MEDAKIKEIANSKMKRGWLREHIDTFVKPVVGEFDETPLGYFTTDEHTVIKNVWRSIKSRAKGRKINLTGKMYIFEVLARRENYPTEYTNSVGARVSFGNELFEIFSIEKYFPTLSFSHNLWLKILNTPSYWDFFGLDTPKEEFVNAARLTIEMYKNTAPAFIDAANPLTFTDRITRRLNGDKNVRI